MTSPATIARKRAGAAQLHRVSAGEAMHRGVLSVPFQTPLTKVAEMMARYRMHCVVALDERGEYQTRYWGLIPAAELVRIATTQDLEDRTAGGGSAGRNPAGRTTRETTADLPAGGTTGDRDQASRTSDGRSIATGAGRRRRCGS